MRTTAPRTQRAHRAQLLVVVAALVVGLLGMHVLTAHGTSPEAMPTPALTAATVSTQDLGAHGPSHDRNEQAGLDDAGAFAMSSRPSAALHQDGAAGGGHGSHSPGSMLIMCLAMLAVALTVLWSISRPRVAGFSHASLVFAARPEMAHALRLRLGTGPPPTWQFSVIRC